MLETRNSAEPESENLPRLVVLLHWLLAAFVFFLFVSSWWMLSLPLPSAEFTYRELPFQLHKNIGITLFVVVITMAAIRIRALLREASPPQGWLRRLAVVDHILLYTLLTVCCLSGYMSSSYSGWTTTLWWLVDIPSMTAENDDLNILFSEVHLWSCWALLGLLLLHIGAAIYHGIGNDGAIDKMFRLR
ncbi:MAG: cytochrome b561 [Pseudohongiellaceae bacterium]|jgi:cytochrome b561